MSVGEDSSVKHWFASEKKKRKRKRKSLERLVTAKNVTRKLVKGLYQMRRRVRSERSKRSLFDWRGRQKRSFLQAERDSQKDERRQDDVSKHLMPRGAWRPATVVTAKTDSLRLPRRKSGKKRRKSQEGGEVERVCRLASVLH